MLEQTLWVAHLLHVQHNDAARLLGVEGLVQMFQHILDTQLCAVTHSPHAVEGQTIRNTVLLDKHCRSTRAGDKVHTMRVKCRDRRVKAACVVRIQETRAVRSDERAAYSVDAVDDVLLNGGTFGVLLRETRTDDNETFCTLLLGQHVHRLRAELGSNAQDGTVHLRQVFHLRIALDALHLGFLGVYGIHLAFEIALQQVFQSLAARLMDIGRCTADDDAFRI